MRVSTCETIFQQAGGIKLSSFPEKKGYNFYTFYKEVSDVAKEYIEFQKKWLEDLDVDLGTSGQIPSDKIEAFTAAMAEPYSKEVEIRTKPFLTIEEWIDTAEKAGLSVGLTSLLEEFLVIQ